MIYINIVYWMCYGKKEFDIVCVCETTTNMMRSYMGGWDGVSIKTNNQGGRNSIFTQSKSTRVEKLF
jgi:hypothetical protein